MWKNCLSVLLAIMLAPTVHAKDVDGEFAAFSVGGEPCAHYLDARRHGGGSERRYLEWVKGYFTAFNLIVANTYDIIGDRNLRQLQNWLEERCSDDQELLFVNAVAELSERLYPNRKNLAPGKNNAARWDQAGSLTGFSKP